MIIIKMKDSTVLHWNEGEWDDYKYDGKFFIVIKNGAWIGFYNLDFVISIVVDANGKIEETYRKLDEGMTAKECCKLGKSLQQGFEDAFKDAGKYI